MKQSDLLNVSVPFIIPAAIPTGRTTRNGMGVWLYVTAAANTTVTVTHGLGRKIKMAWSVANNGGASFTPKLMFGTTVNTNTQVNLIGDVAMTNALVCLF